MNTPMNPEELQEFYRKLSELISTTDERTVRSYIDEQFPRLPESVQQEIMMSLLISTIQDEVQEHVTLDTEANKTIDAMDKYSKLRGVVEKEFKDSED